MMPSSRRRPAGLAATLGGVALLLGACSAPTELRLSLQAQPRINPDTLNLPQPVQLHVYLLRSNGRFNATDYFTLSDPTKHPLENDVVATQSLVLRPQETQTLKLPLDPDAHYVGVSAAFQRIDDATWHVSIPVPDSGKVSVSVNGDAVSLKAN